MIALVNHTIVNNVLPYLKEENWVNFCFCHLLFYQTQKLNYDINKLSNADLIFYGPFVTVGNAMYDITNITIGGSIPATLQHVAVVLTVRDNTIIGV